METIYSVIIGTGSYLPTQIVKNEQFLDNEFYDINGQKITKPNEITINKFKDITEIEERRYVEDNLVTSDIGFFAAQKAIQTANIDKETIDYIIVAHNFGDVRKDNQKTDTVPSIASRIKSKLEIKNPNTIAYDILFGCPGWLQALIQANYFIKSGDAKRILVIGAETLSRISDPHDIDSMIYSDGAGAVILDAVTSNQPIGIIKHKTRSDSYEFSNLLKMGISNNAEFGNDTLFLKMNGRKLYEYALNTVPQMVKECIEQAGILLSDIKKVLIHQANAKMDDAILLRIFKLFGHTTFPKSIIPMTISKLGNNSVATIPILLDLILKGKLENHELNSGDYFVFASVGAGMNVNVAIYKMP